VSDKRRRTTSAVPCSTPAASNMRRRLQNHRQPQPACLRQTPKQYSSTIHLTWPCSRSIIIPSRISPLRTPSHTLCYFQTSQLSASPPTSLLASCSCRQDRCSPTGPLRLHTDPTFCLVLSHVSAAQETRIVAIIIRLESMLESTTI
jgi:hypothetical protein